jgi:hypothetical protein
MSKVQIVVSSIVPNAGTDVTAAARYKLQITDPVCKHGGSPLCPSYQSVAMI